MTEDYPRYPDIHDLDLTLLNPRMIVVCLRAWRCSWMRCRASEGRLTLLFFFTLSGCHTLHEPEPLHGLPKHTRVSGVQPLQDNGTSPSPRGQCCWRGTLHITDSSKCSSLECDCHYISIGMCKNGYIVSRIRPVYCHLVFSIKLFTIPVSWFIMILPLYPDG